MINRGGQQIAAKNRSFTMTLDPRWLRKTHRLIVIVAVHTTGKHTAKGLAIRPVVLKFLPWVTLGIWKMLCRVPEKLHMTKAAFADACLPCALCRVRHTANPLLWAFRALLWAHSKGDVSLSGNKAAYKI